MSHANLAAAFAPAEARYRHAVLVNTWGHLAPCKNRTYRGRIVYTLGVFDSGHINPTIIFCELKNRTVGELSSSPWFYDSVGEFIDSISWKPESDYPKRKGHGEVGCVYEWRGTFRNYKWDGMVRLLADYNK